MKKLLKITAILLFISTVVATAQDKIYKTGGEVLEAKVMEIGSTEIKYKVFANINGPMYTISKNQVLKITYENGKTETFEVAQSAMGDVGEKRAQNIFIELGAQGLLFSANYDTRFGDKRNGIGGRIGIGATSSDDFNSTNSTSISIPISLNYLLGSGKNFFEIGLGATYLKTTSSSIFSDSNGFQNGNERYTTVIGTMAFMYRLQPIESGFSFRGGFTPIFYSEGFRPFAGLSLGYTF